MLPASRLLLPSFILSLCVTPLLPRIAFSDTLRDPVALPEQLPLATVHLSSVPQGAGVLPEGSFRATTLVSWTNSFILEDEYLIDAETREGRLGVTFGATEGAEIGILLPVQWRGGGVLDRVIDGWHNFFNLPQGDREKVEDDHYTIAGVTDSGESFVYEDTGTRIGNIQIPLKVRLHDNERGRSALGATISLPGLNQTFGHQGIDALLSYTFERDFDALRWTTGISGVLVGDTSQENVDFERTRFEGFTYLDYKLTEEWAVGAAVYGSTKRIDNLPTYPDYTVYLDVEAKHRCGSKSVLAAVVRENPAPHDSTADVTFALEFRYG